MNYANWASVNVYAIVWNVNTPPKISYINPTSDPVLIQKWKSKSFSIWMTDLESENIYYTISADSGTVSLLNWTIAWSWSINFVYLAALTAWSTKIYVTLNDWINFVVKQINIYVY